MDNFKLNHWLIDVNGRMISKPNDPSSSPKVLNEYEMAVLVFLSLRPNQLITVKQIVNQMLDEQSGSSMAVSIEQHQQALITTINKLKEHFAGQSDAIEIIIGSPEIGYRLTVNPEPIFIPQSKQGSINAFAFHQQSSNGKQTIFSSAGLIALIIFIALIITLAALGLSYDEPTTKVSNYNTNNSGDTISIPRIAVIPFNNKSEDGDDDYLGDGIAQELINNLAALSNIDVLAHSSSFSYKDKRMNPYQIGSRLNAKYVLKGSVKKDKQQIAITMQLLWVKNNIEVWSKTYQQPYSQLINLQQRMFIDISKQLNLPLPVNLLVPSGAQTKNSRYGQKRIEAYHHYLVAKSYSKNSQANQLTKAISRLNQAIAEDATFALAYTLLAEIYIKQWQLGYIGRSNAERKAQVALDKAFLLSPDLPEAFLVKGKLQAGSQQLTQARQSFEQAIKLRPNYAEAHLQLGIDLQQQTLFNQAQGPIERAISLDPNNTKAHQQAAINELSMGELEQGIKHLVKTIDQSSSDISVEMTISDWYVQYGDNEKAHQWATVALTKVPNDPRIHIALAKSANSNEQAEHHLNQAQQLSTEQKQYFDLIAQVYYQKSKQQQLNQYVQQHLYSPDGTVDTSNDKYALVWAGINHINNKQYQQAIKLLEHHLNSYQTRTDNPTEQIKLSNLLAYCYKKLNNNNKMTEMLKRSKRVQTDLIRNGLKTPAFVIEMVAYYTIADEQSKAEQLLRNATSKGWRLNSYILSNPIFELLSSRQRYMIQ